MKIRKIAVAFFLACGMSVSLWSDSIKVFAASSTKLAMSEIVQEFERLYPDDKMITI